MLRIASFAVLCHSLTAAHTSAVHHSAKRLSQSASQGRVSVNKLGVFFFCVLNPWVISTLRQHTLQNLPSSAGSLLLPLIRKALQTQPCSAASAGTPGRRQLAPTCCLPRAAERSCAFVVYGLGLTKQWHDIRGDERDGFVCGIRIRVPSCRSLESLSRQPSRIRTEQGFE